MKLRSFIKRFKRVINLVSVLSNTSDYFLWIQAYLKLFIHSVLLGKIYILLTYLVFNVQINGGPKWTRTTDLTLIRRAL